MRRGRGMFYCSLRSPEIEVGGQSSRGCDWAFIAHHRSGRWCILGAMLPMRPQSNKPRIRLEIRCPGVLLGKVLESFVACLTRKAQTYQRAPRPQCKWVRARELLYLQGNIPLAPCGAWDSLSLVLHRQLAIIFSAESIFSLFT